MACSALVVAVAVMALAGFPGGFLDGTAPYWQYPAGDFAEHIIGGRYFLADAWRLPLLRVPDLGIPEGTNIGLTDSIPIAALVAKLLRGLSNPAASYIPVWIVLCYLAQGPAGALALYAMGVRRAGLLFLGGLLLVFTPVLLARFGHPALCAQFLLLLALALHAHAGRSERPARALALYGPLLVATLLVHVYLFAMVFAIATASLLQALWTDRLTARAAALHLGGVAVAVFLVMVVCGYLSLGPIPLKPYGEFALNLAAPLWPGPSGVFGLPDFSPTIGFESYAWPGAGILLLLGVSLVLWHRRLPDLWQEHFPTLVILLALIVLACSYAVRLGPVLVLGIDADSVRQAVLGGQGLRTMASLETWVDWLRLGLYLVVLAGVLTAVLLLAWHYRRMAFLRFVLGAMALVVVAIATQPRAVAVILSNFQASARFVWVLLYWLAVLAIAGVCRRLPPRMAALLLAAAVGLQVCDIAPLWRTLQQDARTAPAHPADEAPLATAIRGANRVMLVPTFLCAYAEPLDPPERLALIARIIDVQVIASRWSRPINSLRHSRMTATDTAGLATRCAAEREAVLAQSGDPGQVTFVFEAAPNEAAARATLLAQPQCRGLSSGVLCAAGRP